MKKFLVVALVLVCSAVSAETLTALLSLSLTHVLKATTVQPYLTEQGLFKKSQAYQSGTATDALECNGVYAHNADITSATAHVYDLQDLEDGFGGSLVFNRVKVFAIKNLSETGSLQIGSGSTPFLFDLATATIMTIPPMGLKLVVAPYAGIDASTTERLISVTTPSVASYDMVILGIK